MAAALRVGRSLHIEPGRQTTVLSSGRAKHVCRRGPTACAAQQDSDPLGHVAAMQEALELYAEAQRLAQQQVLQELTQMRITDMAAYQDELNNQQGSSTAQQASRPPAPATALQPLQCFWIEQGLRPSLAASVAQDMVAAGSRFCDVSLLSNQVQRLSRIIPGRLQEVVSRDWCILETSPDTIARHFIQLVQLFPDSLDVSELACKQPKLLYCTDLVAQFERAVAKLVQLHPSHSPQEARALLVEYPELLFRLDYYQHVTTLDELPIELQNLFVYTGQGLHHLHRMHSDSISPHFL